MADANHTVSIAIEARTTALERALKRIEKQTSGTFGKLGKDAKRGTSAMEKSLAAASARMGALNKALGALSLAGAATSFIRMADAATKMGNQLRIAGLSGAELDQVYARLFASAQKNAVPITSMVELYGKLSIASKELGLSQDQLLQFNDRIGAALKVMGTDAQAASGSLLQLSQALGGGIVRAEEFNSMLEGTPAIVQAVAKGLQEAGGSVGKLRNLVNDGKISSRAFFEAFIVGSADLEKQAASAEMTVSQAFIRLQNVLIDTAGKFNENSEASKILIEFMDDLSAAIRSVGVVSEWVGKPLGSLADWLNSIQEKANAAGKALHEMLGIKGFADEVKKALGIDPNEVSGPDALFDQMQKQLDEAQRAKEEAAKTAAATVQNKPVSIADYPVENDKAAKTAKATKKALDDYQRATKSVHERTAAIQGETAALSGLNPRVNDYGFSIEKARMEAELLTAAQNAGRAITPALRTEIGNLAEAYATASSEAEKLAISQDKAKDAARDAAEFNRDLIEGAFSDLKSALADGKLEWDGLAQIAIDAIDRITQKFIDAALDQMVSNMVSGGGLLGALMSIFTGKGSGGGNNLTTGNMGGWLLGSGGGETTYGAPVGAVIRAPLAPLGGGAVAQQAWNFFRGKGLSEAQTAGVLGHMKAESAFNPGAIGDGGNAFGLFQWNDRSPAMKAAVGPNWASNTHGQLDFAWSELNGSEAAALAKLKAATNVEDATKAFGQFERPQGYSADNPAAMHNFKGRLEGANQALDKFSGQTEEAGQAIESAGSKLEDTATANAQKTTAAATSTANALGGITGMSERTIAGLSELAGGAQNLGNVLQSFMASANGGGSGWFGGLAKLFGGSGGALNFMSGISPAATMSILGAGGGFTGLFDSGGHIGGGITPFGPKTKIFGNGILADSGFGPSHFPAILKKGETVLDESMTDRTIGVMRRVGGLGSVSRDDRKPVNLNVTVNGATGNDEVRRMARQGAREAVEAYDQGQRRGGFGRTQSRFNSMKA